MVEQHIKEERLPGYDHPHFPYWPRPARKPIRWPHGAQLAAHLTLYLEYFEMFPPKDTRRDPRFVGDFGSYDPDFRAWSQREYGNRVGIFRILEVLDRFGLKANVAAGAEAIRRYPELVDACLKRGYPFVAHGGMATRMITSQMSEAEERAHIADSAAAVKAVTGAAPAGWCGQDFNESTRTPALLAAMGFDHVMDWPNDDQPYLMGPWSAPEPDSAGRTLVSIPQQPDWDDAQVLWLKRFPDPRFPEVIEDAFRTLHADGARSGTTLHLALHPWCIGQAQRIRYLAEALHRIRGVPGVWWTTAGEIAAAARPQLAR